MPHRAFTAAFCSGCLALHACSGYKVTLNEQPVNAPADLVSSEGIADHRLAACVDQTIADQKIIEAQALTRLRCSYAGISSLAGLGQFEQLRELDLSNNVLRRVEILYRLEDLVYVDLQGNAELSCADVKTLAALPREGLEVKQPEHCR